MRKLLTSTVAILTLLLCCFGLVGCGEKSTPPTLSTIELTKSNLFDYVSFNVNYSDYSISTIADKYIITCKVELSTTPRKPNIEFEDCSFTYNPQLLGVEIFLPSNSKTIFQLDYNGYSSTSFYCYKETDYFSIKYDFPNCRILIAYFSDITGNVIVEAAQND